MDFINAAAAVLQIGSYVVGAASVAAAFIPKMQNAVPALQSARKVIDFLACNFLNAKNQK